MYPSRTRVQRYFERGIPSFVSGRASVRWGSPPNVSQHGFSSVSAGGGGGGGGGLVAVVTVTSVNSVSRAPFGWSRVVSQMAARSPARTKRNTARPTRIHLRSL